MDICNQVKPLISKHDTKYREVITIEIKVSCAIYKLVHGANTLTCSELFTIKRSTLALMLQEVVRAINVVFKKLMMWPMGDNMQVVMIEFKNWCGMPNLWVLLTTFTLPQQNLMMFLPKTTTTTRLEVIVLLPKLWLIAKKFLLMCMWDCLVV